MPYLQKHSVWPGVYSVRINLSMVSKMFVYVSVSLNERIQHEGLGSVDVVGDIVHCQVIDKHQEHVGVGDNTWYRHVLGHRSCVHLHLPSHHIYLDKPGVLVSAFWTRGPLVLTCHSNHVSSVSCPNGLTRNGSLRHGQRSHLLCLYIQDVQTEDKQN